MKLKLNKIVVTSSIIMNVLMITALVYITKTMTIPDRAAAPLIVLLSKPEGATASQATYGQVLTTSPLN
jgi:hypothetical protein